MAGRAGGRGLSPRPRARLLCISHGRPAFQIKRSFKFDVRRQGEKNKAAPQQKLAGAAGRLAEADGELETQVSGAGLPRTGVLIFHSGVGEGLARVLRGTRGIFPRRPTLTVRSVRFPFIRDFSPREFVFVKYHGPTNLIFSHCDFYHVSMYVFSGGEDLLTCCL